MTEHKGGCHCGAVKFIVVAPTRIEVTDCNCSICSKSGYLHLIVPADRFRLVRGEENITTYTFHFAIERYEGTPDPFIRMESL